MEEFFNNKVLAVISLKSDGPVNFVGHEIFDNERRANRAKFLSKHNLRLVDCVTPQLQHGKNVAYTDIANEIDAMLPVDAIMTAKKGLALTVGMGDCPALFLYDPVNEVIALAHCGWKPIVKGIIYSVINGLRQEYNVNPKNLKAYIGPGICGNCFEVDPDVAEKFQFSEKIAELSGKFRVSLPAAIRNRLVEAGLDNDNIRNHEECTKCTNHVVPVRGSPIGASRPKYHSFRRDRSNPLETGMAVLMMKG